MSKFAWVTLATNDSYSLGALVVGNSLKKAETKHQLAVLITPGVTAPMRTKLASLFDVVQEVNVLDSKDAANLSLLARPELGVTFTKLHCWRLTQFEKCVFLDADTLILQNCDELFEREELSAAPDVGWPDCFNSGVFVYRPSLEQFAKLTAFAVKQGSFDGGDQGLLNLFFDDWATKDITRRLPFVYNTCSTACYSYLPAFKQFGQGVKILHFIGQMKPWLINFDSATRQVSTPDGYGHMVKFLQLWWDIFCNEIHPKLSTDMGGLAGALAQLTLGEPRSSEQSAYEESMRQQCWESGNIDYLGTTNTLAKKSVQQSRNVATDRRSSVTKSVQQSTTIATSSTERRSSVTSSTSSTHQQQKQDHKAINTGATTNKVSTKKNATETEKTSSKKQQQQKTAKATATKKSTTESTQKSGIDVNQAIVIVPGHQKVEFDPETNTKTVTEKTTTGYQQTITTVSDVGVMKTQVKTFFDPVEIAGEETIEEEEETYEEVIETTEPTTRTTTTKTTTGASDLVTQQIADQQTTSTTSQDQTQVVSARELPKSTVTKRVLGEEEVRYETTVSEDGKTTVTRKIVTTPAEEIEIVEYEEQEVTAPRELKVITTTKTIPTLANIRSERSHAQSVEESVVVEEEEHTSQRSTTTKQQKLQQQQLKKTQIETQCKTATNVSADGREVETIEYEEQRITEPAAAPKTKTTTKTTTVPASSKTKKTTSEESTTNVSKTTQKQQQLAKRTEDTTTKIVSSMPSHAIVQTTLPDGQEVQVETSLSQDGKTKLLTKTVRQPEEDVEVEDYEETSTTVPRKVTTKSKNSIVAVDQTDEEQQNTIKTDKTRTRSNKMASETILVDAQSDQPIGQHQQVATSVENSNVTGVATTSIDAKRGAVTSKVAASETNTKTLNQEEITVLPNQTKTSKKSETHTESRTITSSQTSSGGNVRQQRDSLTDTNLAAIRQKQQTIASVDKSVTAAVEDNTVKKITQQQQQKSDVEKRTLQQQQQQQQTSEATSNKSTTTTTTTSTATTQQQQKKLMEGQLKLSSADKQFSSQVVSTTTDPKTGEVTTEEVRHFDGGREHIYTTVRKDGTMKMSSKTFFDAVPVEGSEEEYGETTTTTTENAAELAKKKLHRAVSSKQTAAADVNQPIPPPRKKEVKPVSQTKSK